MDELIIRGGLVMDGTGAPGYRADVAVSQGKITAIGDLKGRNAGKVLAIAGSGLISGWKCNRAEAPQVWDLYNRNTGKYGSVNAATMHG